MAIILNIDTSVAGASVCISSNAQVLSFLDVKNDSARLHQAIAEAVMAAGLTIQQLEAVAVVIGPGSYTGLRVGLSTAKGLCFAGKIPLVTVNTLYMMAAAIKDRDGRLVCPMIDARRQEVFMAVYDSSLQPIIDPCAMVLTENSLTSLLKDHSIIFAGNGSQKWRAITTSANAVFNSQEFSAADLAPLAEKKYAQREFSDLAYSEPLYLKEFYFPAK